MNLPEALPPLELTEEVDGWVREAVDPAVRAAWPARLTELHDVLAATLRRHHAAEHADDLAAECAAAVAQYCGGRQVYWPLGAELDQAIVRLRIYRAWQRWTGSAGEFLDRAVRQFRVSQPTVHAAVKEGLQRHREAVQARLPL